MITVCYNYFSSGFKLNPFQPKYIGVGGDANGLIPSLLRDSLQAKWKPEDASNPASDIPKVS